MTEYTGYNSIRLVRGETCLTLAEHDNFRDGDTLYGDNAEPEVLQVWPAEKLAEAQEELGRHFCKYERRGCSMSIVEYGLEYCDLDEDGEFMAGSDYDLAEDAEE